MMKQKISKDQLPDILTAQDISDYICISRRRVYELLQLSPKHGGIPNLDIGTSRRVTKEDFLKWIDDQIKAKAAS